MQVHPSVNVNELRRGIERELRELATPLVSQLETIDSLIAERVADLSSLREVRGELVKSLRPLIGEDAIPLEPGRNSKPGPKPKPGNEQRGTHTRVAAKKVEAALAFLREHYNGNEFVAKDLERGMGISNSATNAVVLILREREQIVITRENKGPLQPRRYKVVS